MGFYTGSASLNKSLTDNKDCKGLGWEWEDTKDKRRTIGLSNREFYFLISVEFIKLLVELI